MRVEIPELCLLLLMGPAGAGKSTFAGRFFAPTEIVSSDACRALVSDDEANQAATGDAFEVLHLVVEKRLGRGRLTVVDATNVSARARRPLLAIAKRANVPAAAVVFALPAERCIERDRARARSVGEEAIRKHVAELSASLPHLGREGFRRVHVLRGERAADEAEVIRARLPSNRRDERGPFDLVGDVHGCYDELRALLGRLGYEVDDAGARTRVRHPEGRRLVFLGDVVDRGPKIVPTLRLVMDAAEDGVALCVCGNHEAKLSRRLRGHEVRMSGGLERSLEQLEAAGAEFRARVEAFLGSLPSHLQLDGRRLVAAHAGLASRLQGRDSPKVTAIALYGETTGALDADGFPVRIDWAASYGAAPLVVYGHTPVEAPYWRNETVNVDTGCVFGGSLTALRYPERETVSVPALRAWAERRPRGGPAERPA